MPGYSLGGYVLMSAKSASCDNKTRSSARQAAKTSASEAPPISSSRTVSASRPESMNNRLSSVGRFSSSLTRKLWTYTPNGTMRSLASSAP